MLNREGMNKMKKLPVADHLTESEYRIFLQVYAEHNRAMGLEKRKNFTLSDVVKVESNPEESCVNVHYKNGDWWHYSKDGTWY